MFRSKPPGTVVDVPKQPGVVPPPPPPPPPPSPAPRKPEEEEKARDKRKDEAEGEADDDTTTVEKARVEDEERPHALMSAVRRRSADMEACLEDIDSDVTLQVTVRLDSSGAVRDPKIAGVGNAVAACVADVLRSVTVSGHDGGSRVVRFPLYFTR
jgi:hypothetical protein